MLECTTKTCMYNKDNECGEDGCFVRTIERVPNYAEEQLEHAKEKGNRCYKKDCNNNKENRCQSDYFCDERLGGPINYEEEYYKLKKENEDYSIKITILEQENKEYKHANEGLAAESKERLQTIKKLQRLIEDNSENVELRNKIEDLERELKEVKEKNEELYMENDEYNAIINSLKEDKGNLLNRIKELEVEIYNNLKDEITTPNYKAELDKLRCQFEEAKHHIEKLEEERKETKEKLENYRSIKNLMKILAEGL